MIDLDYPRIQKEIFKSLPSRTQEVLRRRFGLENAKAETLESIGRDFQVTRERVRQVEKAGLAKLRENSLAVIQPVSQYLKDYLKQQGDLKREDLLLQEAGSKRNQPYLRFFLVLAPDFYRIRESDNYYPFWTIQPEKVREVEKTLQFLIQQLNELHRPLTLEEILQLEVQPDKSFITSCLEAAKRIEANWKGYFGLVDWPDIRPRRLRDKIYLVLREEKKPLHFSQITNLINQFNQRVALVSARPALVQTVHNELIRDDRFVLVGRGTYALREWGYEPGTVKEVIVKILKESGGALPKEEIIARVLEQRKVEKTTILLNLSRGKIFERSEDGYYRLTI